VLSDLLLRRSRDPRLEHVAITRVRLTADLRLARVFFTLLDDRADRAEAERGLEHAIPFLRRGVADAVALRYVPDLAFSYDAALVDARRVDSLLREARAADDRAHGTPEGEADPAARERAAGDAQRTARDDAHGTAAAGDDAGPGPPGGRSTKGPA